MASSHSARRSSPVSPTHRTDEDLINKSLLDSIDADVDATSLSHTLRIPQSSNIPKASTQHYQQQTHQQPQQQVHSSVAATSTLTTNHSSPTSAHSPNLAQPMSSQQSSTTPVSSSYSHSNSSQHDLSSPPHFTAMPSTESTPDAYQSQPSSSSAATTGRLPNVLDSLDTAMNGSQPFRNPNAFNSPFPSTFSPVHGGPTFHSLGLPPSVSSQQQAAQRQPQPFRGGDHLPPSAGGYPPSHGHFPTSPPAYPTKADVFGTGQPMDALGRYDLDAFGPHDLHGPPPQQQQAQQQQQQSQGLKMPQTFNAGASFNLGGTANSSALLQSQQMSVSKLSAAASGGPGSQGFGTGMNGGGGGLPYLNGVGQNQGPPPPPPLPPPIMQGPPNMNGVMSPYGGPTPHSHGHGHGQHPMLHVPGPGPGPQPPQGSQGQQAQQQQQSQQQQVSRGDQVPEEISTIFVVGFPDDMQEREFQNMFTFSIGFEAATLKIPNKDSSAYGPASASNRQAYGQGVSYSGSQDPYNLVTVNSGGVVVDGPQGTSSSWQQGPDYGGDGAHGQPPTMPPRKQIIGFAKFRTRQEALEARDLLQGRRVDIEKGAVLKAEMAKKNLHTKRGVGPLGLPVGLMGVAGANANAGGGVVAPEMLGNMPGLSGYPPNQAVANLDSNAQLQGPDALSVRDRQMGALGAMGLAGPSARRQDDDKDRRPSRVDEEDQRRKKEKEQQERNNKLRMSNVQVYDAFHSVPADHPRRGSSAINGSAPPTGPLSPPAGFGDSNSTFPGFGFNTNGGPSSNTFQLVSNGVGTIGQVFPGHGFPEPASSGNVPNWGPPGKASLGDVHKPPRPPSAQSSPPSSFDAPYIPPGSSIRGGFYGPSSDSSAFSPPEYPTALPPIGPRPRAHSPTNGESHAMSSGGRTGPPSLPRSSASSVAGSQSSLEEHFSRTLTVSTHQGMTSPQLPSPGSGGSSSTNVRQGNASDQNPPINTLYVGNLPNSPMPPGFALEEALKNLFSQCKGYRKLCFRQKSNGPMCFVEFEDVQHATKALNELYGNQLNGLVKGGIRLSFSKNPLGVRPPQVGSTNNPPTVRRESSREGWNGPIQPPGAPGINYSSIHDAFQTRPLQPQQGQQQPGLALDVGVRPGRLDLGDLSPPANSGFPYNVSSPPSRFFSPPPSQSSFGTIAPSAPSNGFSRSSSQGFGQNSSATFGSNPSPFGTSTSEDERIRFRDVQFTSSPGLETTRVG